MKSVDVIQEVKVLPRATASHQPGRNTRWREETNVRSRVEHVSRVVLRLESCVKVVVPQGITTLRMPDPRAWEARTVSRCWNAVSSLSLWQDRVDATGVVDQVMLTQGEHGNA